MREVTKLLAEIEQGDPRAAVQLLPLVYEELRKLATAWLGRETPGQTLQATALVHEAYLRLVNGEKSDQWNDRGHFFAAAAQAMRRILIENARRKKSLKGGGARARQDLDGLQLTMPELHEDVLALDEALGRLAGINRAAADLVQLRYFAGLTLEEAAAALDISPRTAGRLWAFARTWLLLEIQGDPAPETNS
jgi:RNA polymerase sigma factor (TIGR02999 family)